MSFLAENEDRLRYLGKENHTADRVAIIVSRWNPTITEKLFEGARMLLQEAGLRPDNILRYDVPGSFELPMGANMALHRYSNLDGVICLGCIIQGETRHFDFISQAVANGVMEVGLDHNKPVIFGVLTPNSQEQAEDRVGGKHGHKGAEAAAALLEMVDLARS